MTGIPWYDRDGEPISTEQANALFGDPEYKRVALDTVGEAYTVSTVWLGLDHNFGSGGPPVIFETMVFAAEQWHGPERALHDLDCRRYSTEAEALKGHRDMVTLIRATAIGGYDIGDLQRLDRKDEP